MIIIGERINTSRKSINEAVEKRDQQFFQDEARKQAMRNAIANAKLYAETAGVELGPVLTITEEDGSYVPRYAEAPALEMAKDVPIEAGTATVQVRLKVTWELR